MSATPDRDARRLDRLLLESQLRHSRGWLAHVSPRATNRTISQSKPAPSTILRQADRRRVDPAANAQNDASAAPMTSSGSPGRGVDRRHDRRAPLTKHHQRHQRCSRQPSHATVPCRPGIPPAAVSSANACGPGWSGTPASVGAIHEPRTGCAAGRGARHLLPGGEPAPNMTPQSLPRRDVDQVADPAMRGLGLGEAQLELARSHAALAATCRCRSPARHLHAPAR